MVRMAVLGLVALAAACSSETTSPAAPPAPRPVAAPAPVPAPVAADAGITTIPTYDPRDGLHLDEDNSGARRGDRGLPRQRRVLEITLRSLPSGAIATVDGVVVGSTPVLWEGEFTGLAREFTFVMPGYAMARYRFIPVASGVVHGRLVKIGDTDAGPPAIVPPVDVRTVPRPSESAPPSPAPDAMVGNAAAEAPRPPAAEGTAVPEPGALVDAAAP